MTTNRIDPTAAPSTPNPVPPPTFIERNPWVPKLGAAVAGATLAALCPFIPIPALQAVCVAVAGVVGKFVLGG